MQTKTIEEYIEEIYILQKKHGHAHTNDLASSLGVAPPSVTEMLQKLSEKKLITYVPYYGATLTKDGVKMAEDLLERHRTVADFLEIIGVDRKDAEFDACQIEHHVKPGTIEKLNVFVKFVRDAPRNQIWLEHFKHFSETGERLKCEKRKN
jgi:DtxR family Mn-dependent transcriptional regulator